MTSNLAIAPSLAPVQTPLLAPVLTSPICLRNARRPSPDGYGSRERHEDKAGRQQTYEKYPVYQPVVQSVPVADTTCTSCGHEVYQLRTNLDARTNQRGGAVI